MRKFFCAIFLIIIAQALKQFRLSSVGFKQLTPNDTIVSTFGHFRIKLLATDCTLSIENFNMETSKYSEKGKYKSQTYQGNCQYLNITDGKIVTDNGSSYLTVINKSFNYSTVLTIDDEGVIRLIGTFISSNQVDIVSEQTVIQDFKTENKYIKAFSEYEVSFTSRFEAFANERKWKFIAEFGQLTIYYGEDPGKKLDYVYSAISIRDSRIYDFSNKTFPATIFNNITFQPRCSQPMIYLDFKAPFVFVADPYWPIVSVFDQGGYRIIEVAYFDIMQYDFSQGITEINYHHFSSPCPRRTFQHKGDCVASCPAPYYHLIKGQTGKCVLVCQQYSKINENTRVCSCVTDYEFPKLSMSDLVIGCPSSAVKTPYGCQCKTQGEFYDSLLSFKCVKTCPNTTYGINGLCMQCPQRCKACQRDNFNRIYLECIECDEGYHLYKAQCVKDCINNYGFSQISGKCEKCEDVNCFDCSNDPKVCLKCNLLTTLTNGTCKNNCTAPARQVYSQYFSTQCLAPPNLTPPLFCTQYISSHYQSKPFLKCDFCLSGIAHLDVCVSTCPTGYYSHNGKYCACDGVKNLTIYNQCFDQIACPITMSFDIRSHSCLSCPFGCMSCINTQCTSCNPGYFLYISPQSILCRKKSPLFPCDKQYSWQRDTVCLVTDYTNPQIRMTQCVNNIQNCTVCIPGSDMICVLCDVGFYIYNNTCIEQCPSKMIPYENTCILPEIPECEVPHLESIHQEALITFKKIQQSKPYGHYIYDNKEAANDPVGYIPIFQDLSTRKNDGVPRDTEFFQVQWVCIKCKDGYGLSEGFQTCPHCPSVCSSRLCYMARDDSCLSKQTDNVESNCTSTQFIDSLTGKCLQSCNDPSKYPQIQQNKLYCKPATNSATKGYLSMDSAIYQQSDGSNLVFFVFSRKLQDNLVNLPIKYLGSLQKHKKSNRKLQNQTESNTTDANNNGLPSQLTVQNGGYLFLNESAFGQTFNAYQINLTDKITQLIGEGNSQIFPNKIYGTMVNNDHPKFITYWLAYIGYIMSIAILLLHFVFIGNELLYKVDNLIIFVQTIFYFSFAKNLVGRLVSQFYYGWSFSHAGFLPNLFEETIPDYYAELDAPESFKLVNVDGNYFRNAGFSLAWLLIYMGCCLLAILFIRFLIYQVMGKKESWYPRIAKQAFLGGVQFFSMNLMFFSVTQLQYGGTNYPNVNQKYHNASVALSIITIVVLSIYTIVRYLFHKLGGIYMAKRLILAVFLALSYEKTIYLLPVIITQIVFMGLRYAIEAPEQRFNKVTIFIEEFSFILCYILLFLSIDAGANSLILSIFIFVLIVYLAYDLTTIYLESRDQYPEDELIEDYSQRDRYEKAERVSGGNFSRRQSALNYGYGESAVVV